MSALWILNLPKSSVLDLLVLPTNRWWTQADKKHLTCEDVIRDINLAKIWNLVIVGTWNQYFVIFCKFEYCKHTCTISISRYCYCENEQFTKHYFSISAWIPNIKEEKRKNINVRKMFTSSKLKTMGVISQIRNRL